MENKKIERYKVFDLELEGHSDGNPFRDCTVSAVFTNGIKDVTVKGFYKGDGLYGIRFMPDEEGTWEYIVKSDDKALDGHSGSFICTPAGKENHGRVLVKKDVTARSAVNFYGSEDDYQFSYEDGTRFQPFGTTCYAWINQDRGTQEETLESLEASPFNKIRMCVFPKFYSYNNKDPESYAFIGNPEDGFDYTRFDNSFFNNLERRIRELDDIGVQADIILLHPYDRWGFSRMTKEEDIFYLSYIVRRLSHFKNVWWSLANEYDLMPWKTSEDWDTYARVVIQNDPYGHLRSIHNCIPLYDHHKTWITHVSVQRVDVYKTAEMVTDWRDEYRKPVIVDEVGYEGNIDFGWGNLTAEEETRRFWEGCLRGGFMTHGETYIDRGERIWWSHGGKLYGESPSRIAFLKEILSEAPEGAEPIRLTAENHDENWDSVGLHDGEGWYLYYYGFARPLYRNYTLPAGKRYRIELIDTWDMTTETLPGTYEGRIRIRMGARQYMAVRMREV